MKFRLLTGVLLALAVSVFVACDDNTDTIGSSLIGNLDKLNVQTDTFKLSSQSIIADSVLSRNATGYVGRVKDPQTGAYVTGDFMTQFHVLEGFTFPEKDSIRSLSPTGEIQADSCELRLYYSGYYGDSLATMKMTAYEMDRPMEENNVYYSNFDPAKEGFVRSGGFSKGKVYTLYDVNVEDEVRSNSSYMENIRIKLDKPYTDKNGKVYSNYGSYVMQKYYENPDYFKDSYAFTHNVVPGFYFKNQGGLGSMGYISISQLNVYFKYKGWVTENDTTYVNDEKVITQKEVLRTLARVASFAGTEEVLQTTNVTNDNNGVKRLAADNTCTYLKTPAGIFTELELPIDDILRGHENDSINSAKVVLTRINDDSRGEYNLGIPQTLLLLPKSEMYSFFEQNKIADYKTSFLATYDSQYNTYTFNNIANIIRYMNSTGDRSKESWNKVVVIPVTTTYNTTSTVQELTTVHHDMSLTSTKLVGGSANANGPIKLSVVYAKFNTNN